MMTCGHPHAHYRDGQGGTECFKCFTAKREARWEATRVELERVLAAGMTVMETRPDGHFVDWQFWPETREAKTQHDGRVGFDTQFVNFSAAALAIHLAARSRGFGYALSVYCFRCGESHAPVLSKADDYMCDDCTVGAMVDAAEQAADGDTGTLVGSGHGLVWTAEDDLDAERACFDAH